MIMDDSAIDAIVSMLMDLQDRENTNLPLYERQLAEINTSIENLLNAIQQGILTRSTKARLEELEAARDEAEARIACEKMASPKISEDFMRFWLHRFRKLDVQQQNHRQMLVDSFINTIYLYDDKIVITFNYKEGTKTVTLDDANKAVTEGKSSNLDSSAVPTQRSSYELRCLSFFIQTIKQARSFPLRKFNIFIPSNRKQATDANTAYCFFLPLLSFNSI